MKSMTMGWRVVMDPSYIRYNKRLYNTFVKDAMIEDCYRKEIKMHYILKCGIEANVKLLVTRMEKRQK